ncbi:RnfH family protein [Variovorax sp. J22P168]|uniref:RnfH family protein n=1 Tax=Variovorax jilinensis TaxID=3053513 RepID=UPI0025758B1C|nr:RnfH family protein [Variovorax sp. J22P168]MDM0013332.1 RnfH family protein [Variovorax sp. J22P168]
MPRVTVACSPAPRSVFEQVVELAEGATVRDAVLASGLAGALPDLAWESLSPGVWGRAVEWTQTVCDQDRIELCRPLTVDPKVARRERFRQQGARGTGLFANRRKGGKAGY